MSEQASTLLGPGTPADPARTTDPPRHRGPRRPHWTSVAPLIAVAVSALVAARTLDGRPLAGDGALAGAAGAWLSGGPAPSPFTPTGAAGLHTAAWAELTGALDRLDGPAAVDRELLWVTLLVSCLLIWAWARRSGSSNGAAATAVLGLGALPGLSLVHAVSSPASLAVPWLLLAGLLGAGRGGAWPRRLGVLCLVPAVLLAPDVLLLVVAAGAGGLATGRLGRAWSPRRRVLGAGVLAPVFLGLVLVLPQWDQQPAVALPWSADEVGTALLTAGLATVGALAAWLLPAWRPPAAALAATALAVVAPPGRFAALVVCLPVAALLVGALLDRLVAVPLVARVRPVLAVAGMAALAVAVGLAAVVLPVDRMSPTDGSATTAQPPADQPAVDRSPADQPDALLDWLADELPAGSLVTGAGDPDPAAGTQGLDVVAAEQVRPTDQPAVIARFGEGAGAVAVLDSGRVDPTAADAAFRRDLSAALLANPTTVAGEEAVSVLESADIDPRLLTLLAGMAAQDGVGIAALPAVSGEVGTPVRRALIASIGGAPLAGDPEQLAQLTTWLAAQLPPYAPSSVVPVQGGLLIGYTYSSDPFGLITAAGG